MNFDVYCKQDATWPLVTGPTWYFGHGWTCGSHVKYDYRETSLKLCCDVIDDVINVKYLILFVIWPVDSEYAIRFLLSETLTEIENWKWPTPTSTWNAIFNRKCNRKFIMSERCAVAMATLWRFKFYCSLKTDWDIAISNFKLLSDLVTLTFDLWPWKLYYRDSVPSCYHL